jgi:hypothetical protein
MVSGGAVTLMKRFTFRPRKAHEAGEDTRIPGMSFMPSSPSHYPQLEAFATTF